MDLAHYRIVGSFGVLTMQRLLFLFFLHDLLHHDHYHCHFVYCHLIYHNDYHYRFKPVSLFSL